MSDAKVLEELDQIFATDANMMLTLLFKAVEQNAEATLDFLIASNGFNRYLLSLGFSHAKNTAQRCMTLWNKSDSSAEIQQKIHLIDTKLLPAIFASDDAGKYHQRMQEACSARVGKVDFSQIAMLRHAMRFGLLDTGAFEEALTKFASYSEDELTRIRSQYLESMLYCEFQLNLQQLQDDLKFTIPSSQKDQLFDKLELRSAVLNHLVQTIEDFDSLQCTTTRVQKSSKNL